MKKQTRIEKTKNIFGQDVYFIVQKGWEDKETFAGVGNLIKYYPSDCECSSGQIAADRIIDLNQERIRVLSYCSDGSYFRKGSCEGPITQDYLDDLILYGYTPVHNEDGSIFLSLENKDYNMQIQENKGKYISVKKWNDGYVRAEDTRDLNATTETEAILEVLANHF